MQSPTQLLRFSHSSIPVIQQTALAECGLACLAMIASYYGFKTDLNDLRKRFPTSLKGATLGGLMQAAHRLNLASRPLRLELDEIKDLKRPAILHWDLNHFVVLVGFKGNKTLIHDPARGRVLIDTEQLSKHFTGVALELYPTPGFTKDDVRSSMKLTDFWTRITGFKSAITQVLILSFALQLFALGGPFYMQLVVDEALISSDRNLLTVIALGFLMLALIEVVTSTLRSWVVLTFSSLMSMQMANNLFRHLIRLPMSYFITRHIGDTVSRFQSLQKIKDMFTTGFVEAFIDGIMSLLLLALLFMYSPTLAWVVLGFILAFLTLRLILFRPFKNLSEEAIIANAKEQSNFMETVRGMQSVKLFGKEVDRQTLWQNRYAELINTGIQLGKFNIGFNTAKMFLTSIENILVIYLGALYVMESQSAFSVGMLFAFVSYKRQFTAKAEILIERIIEFKMLNLHLQRIADIAKTPTERHLDSDSLDDHTLSGALTVNNISYRYSNEDPYIFNNLSIHIPAGQSIAIMGASGGGKTTLLKMMLGLLEPETGSIEVECHIQNAQSTSNIDIRSMGLGQYRQKIAAVMQDDQLLSGTIADNIAFFDSEPNQEWIVECAKLACLHNEIMKMPMDYNSLVGDMGTTLSGGQKQRLLIARALYRQPRILFLDEATSHLDIANERKINSNIKNLSITRIIIAHRKTTIEMADRIVLLKDMQLHELRDLRNRGTQNSKN